MPLKLLSTADCQAVLEFETQNKSYFEQSVPPRADDYFNFDGLYKITESLVKEQKAGQCFLYLLFEADKVIARANLINICDDSSEIGYRLCQSATGQGLATKIVAELLKIAKTNHGIQHIKAHTTTNNPASRRVLEKNGFEHIRIALNATTLNDKPIGFTYYEKFL